MAKRYSTPGPRILSPDCCTSMKLAACSMQAQLLWTRLLVTCDDQGRREAALPLVRAACFPMLEVPSKKLEAWLQELHDAGLIHLYDAEGTPALQVTNWWEYQHTMRRAYASKLMAPKGWTDLVGDITAALLATTTPVGCPDSPQSAADCDETSPMPLPLPLPLPVPVPVGPPRKKRGGSPPDEPDGVDEVLDSLKALVRQHQPSWGDAVDAKAESDDWRASVALLLRRGPLNPATGLPVPKERALAVLEFLREREPRWASGSCWGEQIQSGDGLRRKWHQVSKACDQHERGATNGHRRSPVDDSMAAVEQIRREMEGSP